MDKEKIIKAGMWISGFTFSVFLSSVCMMKGWYLFRTKDSFLLLSIGIIFLIPVFLCAFKAIKLIISAIFD